jgi:hypothetical protein
MSNSHYIKAYSHFGLLRKDKRANQIGDAQVTDGIEFLESAAKARMRILGFLHVSNFRVSNLQGSISVRVAGHACHKAVPPEDFRRNRWQIPQLHSRVALCYIL